MKKLNIVLILLVGISLLLAACSPTAAPAEQVPSTGSTSMPAATEAMPAPTTAAPAATEAMPAATEAMPAATTASTEAAPAATSMAPASAAPLTSKELNLYAWSEYIPQELLDGFTKETGVKVNYDTYSSNEELMAKLQAGGAGYDVIIPSDYTVTILAKQNLLEPLDLSKIPNLANIDPKFLNPKYDPGNKFSVPYQWGTVGLVYNSEKVPTAPTSWADLWDPKYKGRVVLLDDEREVLGMVLRVLGFEKNAIDPAQLNQAKDRFAQLVPNVKLFDSDSPKTALLSGEVWLGLTWNGEAALAHKENPKILYTCPKEGCGIWFDNLAIPKGAPHMDAALAFINYVLRPDASTWITKDFPYSNPNAAALEMLKTQEPDTYKGYMDFSATNPSAEDVKNAKMVEDVGDATTLWDQIWTEVKGSQ